MAGKQKKPFGNLKPGERLKEYLSINFRGNFDKKELRLPPIRKIAAELGISVQTVQRSLKELAETGHIRTEIGNGTFYLPFACDDTIKCILCFPELNLPLPDDLDRINNGIIQAASQHAPRVSVTPFSFHPGSDYMPQLLSELKRTDGIIMFPYIDGQKEILEAAAARNKPVVFYNPSCWDFASANFVSPDFFSASFRLGKAMRESGRRHALLILSPPTELSISNTLRYAGFSAGFGVDRNSGSSITVCETSRVGEEYGYKAVSESLSAKKRFCDLVYCSGDFLAMGVLRALKEHGVNVPRECSVVGATGLDSRQILERNLTRFVQPFGQMGRELLLMLCERIGKNGLALPGRYLPYALTGGSTTRPGENSLLGLN